MMRIARWWLAIVVFLAAFHAIDAQSAHAQTATPTATSTPMPYYFGSYSSVFPGGYNPDSFWVCPAAGAGLSSSAALAAVEGLACFDLGFENIGGIGHSDIFGMSGGASDDSPTEHMYSHLELIAPKDIMTFTLSCDYEAVRYWHEGGGSLLTATSTMGIGERNDVNSLAMTFPNFGAGLGSVATSVQEDISLQDSPAADNGWWESIPNYAGWLTTGVSPGDWPIRLNNAFQAAGQNNAGSFTLECRVSDLRAGDGSQWEEYPYPTPTPTATGTPDLGSGSPIGWNPIDWSPLVPITQEVEFGLSPVVEGDCYDIPPEIGPYTVTIPGWFDKSVYIPGVELCVSEQTFEMELFDVNFGTMVYSIFGLGVLAFFVRTVFA